MEISTINFVEHLGAEFNITFGTLTIHKGLSTKRILEIIEISLDPQESVITAKARQRLLEGGDQKAGVLKSAQANTGKTREKPAKTAGVPTKKRSIRKK